MCEWSLTNKHHGHCFINNNLYTIFSRQAVFVTLLRKTQGGTTSVKSGSYEGEINERGFQIHQENTL